MARRIIMTLKFLQTLMFMPHVSFLYMLQFVWMELLSLLCYKVRTLLLRFSGFGQPVVNHWKEEGQCDTALTHDSGGKSPHSWFLPQKLMQGQKRRGNSIVLAALTLPSSQNHKWHWLDRGRMHREEAWYFSRPTVPTAFFFPNVSILNAKQSDRQTVYIDFISVPGLSLQQSEW